MKAAAVILMQSLNTGKHAAAIQFSTMRKMRGVFSNTSQSSAQGYSSSAVMAKETQKLTLTSNPTYGAFFETFARGCHKRMGIIVKPDHAILLAIMHYIMSLVKNNW